MHRQDPCATCRQSRVCRIMEFLRAPACFVVGRVRRITCPVHPQLKSGALCVKGNLLNQPPRSRRDKLLTEAEGYLALDMPGHALKSLAQIDDPDRVLFGANFLRG